MHCAHHEHKAIRGARVDRDAVCRTVGQHISLCVEDGEHVLVHDPRACCLTSLKALMLGCSLPPLCQNCSQCLRRLSASCKEALRKVLPSAPLLPSFICLASVPSSSIHLKGTLGLQASCWIQLLNTLPAVLDGRRAGTVGAPLVSITPQGLLLRRDTALCPGRHMRHRDGGWPGHAS